MARLKRSRALVGEAFAFVLVCGAILTLPFAIRFDSYGLTIMTNIAMMSIPAMGAWLLIQTGLFSFGQGVFGSVGAYTLTLAMGRSGMGFWVAFLLGGLAALGFASAIVFPFLRTRRVTFSVLTMVALLAIDQIITVTRDVTGGGAGLLAPPLPQIGVMERTIDLASPPGTYYFAAVLLVITLGIVWLVMHGTRGVVLQAIGQNEQLARSLGRNVELIRAGVFVCAGALTGFAGAFSAGYLQVAHPGVWGVFSSIFIVSYAIIGGTRTVIGPIVGTGVVIAGTALLARSNVYETVLVGVGLIIVVLFLPDGIGGRAQFAVAWLGKSLWKKSRFRIAGRGKEALPQAAERED